MNNFNEYLSHEVYVNVYVQQNFQFFEPLFEAISVYCGPTWIIYHIMPILFSHNMILMTRALVAISLLDLLAGVIKWTCGMDRPYWWVRENNGPEIRQHRLTCETTSGFPSSHSVIFTGLIYIIVLSILPHLQTQFRNHPIIVKNLLYLIMWILIITMWLDRLYFGCHFLHQCVIGSTVSVVLISFLNQKHIGRKLYNMEKQTLILMLISIAIITVAIYYKRLTEGTELESVKMGFKWCKNAEYLKHENSPVYWLARSFGLAMGVALSAPLYTKFQYVLNPNLSIPVAAMLIGLNSASDLYAPKSYGRIVFISYGAFRSMCLSYSLLNFLPYLSGIKKQ